MKNIDIINLLAPPSTTEIFTPTEVVNKVLDILPNDIWKNKDIKFLNPCCKSGGFLKEITKRLMIGLQNEILNEKERLTHILKHQIFGVALSEISLLYTRRTLYKSKNIVGNIYLNDSEEHKEMINKMKFDIIVGNPPYNNDLYIKFIDLALDLNPQYISYIIPTNWYNAEKTNIVKTRNNLITKNKMQILHDYNEPKELFPGVNLTGACYFLWNNNHNGMCNYYEHRLNNTEKYEKRYLLNDYTNGIIKYSQNISINIVKKINTDKNINFSQYVVLGKDFTRLDSNFKDFSYIPSNTNVKLYNSNNKNENIFIERSQIPLYNNHKDLIDNKFKIFINESYDSSKRSEPFMVFGINTARIGEPNSCCTGNYTAIGGFDSLKETENVFNYMKTKFFRFLILLKKFNMHLHVSYFDLIPIQDWNESWDDQKLYKKYNLSQEEIDFIESMITKI